MSALYQTTRVSYCVVDSRQTVGDKEFVSYGVKGTDGSITVQLTALSYDYDRISRLVDNMNRGQFGLCVFKDVIFTFFKNSYGINL